MSTMSHAELSAIIHYAELGGNNQVRVKDLAEPFLSSEHCVQCCDPGSLLIPEFLHVGS